MRELALSRLSEDHKHLIARDTETGIEFHIDAHRATSLIGTKSTDGPELTRRQERQHSETQHSEALHSRTPQHSAERRPLEAPMDQSSQSRDVNPREIQTRIRRGESPETVADAMGVDVERIMSYALPVIAEREYIAEQARKTVIRRKHVGGPGVVLGTLVNERIVARGGSPESVRWDAWKRENGRWSLAVTPEGATEPSTFVYDVQSRYVLPEDESARDLVGDVALPDSADMALADAVRSPEDEETPENGKLEGRTVDAHDDAAERHPEGVSSLKAARDRRAMGQLALGEEVDDPPLDETIDEVDSDDTEDQGDETSHVRQDESAEARLAVPDDAAVPDNGRKKRHERRRVPSWDEIMFGGRAGE